MEKSHFYIDYGHMILFFVQFGVQWTDSARTAVFACCKNKADICVVDACSTHMGAKVVKIELPLEICSVENIESIID